MPVGVIDREGGCLDACRLVQAALQWHPDKNPDNKAHAEMMFKNVGEAPAGAIPEQRGDQDTETELSETEESNQPIGLGSPPGRGAVSR